MGVDQDEVEALLAIYGEEFVQVEEDMLKMTVADTEESRVVFLSVTCGEDYPDTAPSIHVEGRRGVPNEKVILITQQLVEEAQVQLGMPMAFALAERAKQLLDELDGSGPVVEEEKKSDATLKAGNHQVGNPLIMDGTKCSEHVFQEWRELWLEKRALEDEKRRLALQAVYDGKPTGKEIWLGLVAKKDDELARTAVGQALTHEAVDASLFVEEDIPSDSDD